MKITVERTQPRDPQPSVNPPPPSDLSKRPSFPRKPTRRKTKTSGNGVRWKRDFGAPSGKRNSRPETPLLKWKFVEPNDKNDSVEQEEEKSSGEGKWRSGPRGRAPVSARKLGAALWRLHLPEFQTNGGERLGLQTRGDAGAPIHGQFADRVHQSPARDLVHSPHSVSGPRNGLLYKFSNSAMEGATKWDPVGCKNPDDLEQLFGRRKPINHQASTAPIISALENELEQTRTRINELETERRSSKKKLEQFLQKLSEERTAWRSREHEKVRAIIDDVKADLSREKKNRQRLEIVNSKLVSELAEAKLSAKRYMQEYEKERKARELIEEVCDELAKEIGEDKAEAEALKRESMKLREEVDEERKMLQMAEVWREERVQMKLVDAKVMLEEKYAQMTLLVMNLESFLKSSGRTSDVEELKKAEFLRQVASSVNIQDVRELAYEHPNPDDIFSIFQEGNFGDSNEGEAEPCGAYSPVSHSSKICPESPEIKLLSKDGPCRHPNSYVDQSGELEDASEWETVSHPEEHGSSYSPDGSDPSGSRNFRISNGTEWERSGGEETPIMEISEVKSAHAHQSKKASSISRLWKSSNGDNFKIISVDGMNGGRLSNGRLSNGVITSSDRGSGKDALSPNDSSGQWSSPDSGHPHITRGMKGCIEWPHNSYKSSLKARLLEARMESQKVQLRQVLKQKI